MWFAAGGGGPAAPPPAKQPPQSEEDIRSFVFDSLFDNRWDNDLRVRRISLTADAAEPQGQGAARTSRAGVNETLTGVKAVVFPSATILAVMRHSFALAPYDGYDHTNRTTARVVRWNAVWPFFMEHVAQLQRSYAVVRFEALGDPLRQQSFWLCRDTSRGGPGGGSVCTAPTTTFKSVSRFFGAGSTGAGR